MFSIKKPEMKACAKKPIRTFFIIMYSFSRDIEIFAANVIARELAVNGDAILKLHFGKHLSA